jgi:hypothetical protein
MTAQPDSLPANSLPTFLIIGAAKSGTTSLYHYLGQHPEIFLPELKEPNFFAFRGQTVSFRGIGDEACNRLSVTSLQAYASLFDDATEPERGEASPSSLYYPEAPRRIRALVPDVRIIAVLRDPVERAYSNYFQMVKQGREPAQTFEAALQHEEARRRAGWSYFWRYTDLGFYHEQLARYVKCFPCEQIFVCLTEDLRGTPLATVQRIYRFLRVADGFRPPSLKRHNRSGRPRSEVLHQVLFHAGIRYKVRAALPDAVVDAIRTHLPHLPRRLRSWKLKLMNANMARPPLSPATENRLRALYRDDILRLQDLIGLDLSAWLVDAGPD